jgi:hypothetical protein
MPRPAEPSTWMLGSVSRPHGTGWSCNNHLVLLRLSLPVPAPPRRFRSVMWSRKKAAKMAVCDDVTDAPDIRSGRSRHQGNAHQVSDLPPSCSSTVGCLQQDSSGRVAVSVLIFTCLHFDLERHAPQRRPRQKPRRKSAGAWRESPSCRAAPGGAPLAIHHGAPEHANQCRHLPQRLPPWDLTQLRNILDESCPQRPPCQRAVPIAP